MAVTQLAVFMENRKGRLQELTETLGAAGIDLVALNIADTGEFGILRAVTRDNERAARLLKDAGFTVQLKTVVAAEVADAAGGLAKMLGVLSAENIDIEYLYSFSRTKQGAVILFRSDDDVRAADALRSKGFKLLGEKI